MYLLPLEPKQDPNYSCLEDLIFSICEWKGEDHRFAFIDCWGFEYNENAKGTMRLAQRIGTGNVKWRTYLKEYSGIEISMWKHDINSNDFINFAKRTIVENEMPIIIAIDQDWCPWNSEFFIKFPGGQGGLPHTCLIIGYKDNNFLCIDPLFSEKVEELPFEYVLKGYGGYMLINYSGQKSKSTLNQQEFLKYISSKILEGKIPELIRRFSKEFINLNLSIESQGFEKKPGLSPIVYKLKLIGMGRFKIGILLDKINEEKNNKEYGVLSEQFRDIAKIWYKLSLNVMKMFYSKNKEKLQLSCVKLLDDIANKEHHLANRLLSLVKDEDIEVI